MTSGAGSRARRIRALALTAAVLVGFAPQANSAQMRGRPDGPPTYAPRPNTIAQRALDVRIGALGRNFEGLVGIAVREIDTGWTTSWNGERHFPQQSVSKFWVALTAFSRMDAGDLSPDDRITIRRQDLTLFHQPVAAEIGPNGYTTTLDNLIFRAITQSDNTCNDAVLRQAGGPEAVRAMLARNQIEGIRFGPGERLMQSQIAGLQWRPAYSVGRAFYTARNAVPEERRRSAFQNYVEDPIDGATPLGIIDGLSRLQRGELLSRRSTARMLSIMSQTRTGRQRLTGGLAPGWRIAHKTGTGQVLGATQAGYNDIGILTSPEGRHYAVAVMIGRTAIPVPQRMALMQDVTRAVIAYNDASRTDSSIR
jgi:beta-lactamase class A